MVKLVKIEGKQVDLVKLHKKVMKLLKDEKFRIVKDDVTEHAYHIRAVKSQVTRIIIGAARDIELIIAGDPENFAVVLIVGSWGKNLAISAATGYIVASTVAAPVVAVGGIAAAGSYLTAVNFEEKLFKKIVNEISKLNKTWEPSPHLTQSG